MSDYRYCLLDASEIITAVDTVQFEDDVRAMVLVAHLIVRKHPQFSAVEVRAYRIRANHKSQTSSSEIAPI
jgi:hypothetical protein